MGRRPDVEAAFDNLERLLGMSALPRSRSHLIYGPRGTGKTVHIRSLHVWILARSALVILLDLADRRVPSQPAMARELF